MKAGQGPDHYRGKRVRRQNVSISSNEPVPLDILLKKWQGEDEADTRRRDGTIESERLIKVFVVVPQSVADTILWRINTHLPARTWREGPASECGRDELRDDAGQLTRGYEILRTFAETVRQTDRAIFYTFRG